MAGKKKVDDVPQSKTARASMAKKLKEEAFKASGDMNRIVPLAGGTWAYVFHPVTGRTHHVKVGSEAWDAVVGELLLNSSQASRIQLELEKLGWA